MRFHDILTNIALNTPTQDKEYWMAPSKHYNYDQQKMLLRKRLLAIDHCDQDVVAALGLQIIESR